MILRRIMSLSLKDEHHMKDKQTNITLLALCELWIIESSSRQVNTISPETLATELIKKFIESDAPDKNKVSWLNNFTNLSGQAISAYDIAFEWFANEGKAKLEHKELIHYANNICLSYEGLKQFCDQASFKQWSTERGLTRPRFIAPKRKSSKRSLAVKAIINLFPKPKDAKQLSQVSLTEVVNEWLKENDHRTPNGGTLKISRETVMRALEQILLCK